MLHNYLPHILHSTQLFTAYFSYIHCDPHPGNVMVQKVDGKTCLVLLDHGLYQTLTDDFRINYCKLWQVTLRILMFISQVTSFLRCYKLSLHTYFRPNFYIPTDSHFYWIKSWHLIGWLTCNYTGTTKRRHGTN